MSNTDTSEHSIIEAASIYTSRGWSVLPLVADEKRPLTRNGLYNATLLEDTINEWYNRWPDANIGIRTGAESGIIVLDVDVKNGAEGLKSLAELESEYGSLPVTLRATTPSGGQHLYFKHPGGKIKNRTSFRPGLDLRCDGGYIVAPPSSIDDKPYEWVDPSLKIADAPEWLVEIIKSKASSFGDHSSSETHIVSGISGVPEGQRNDSVFRYAASLRSKGTPREEAEVSVLYKALNCHPPLPEDEALRCLDSAYQYEPGTVRPCTELGNAERLIDQYGELIRYVPEYGSWMVWDGRRWEFSILGEINQLAKGVVRGVNQEALDCEDDDRRDALLKHARASERCSALSNMMTLASTCKDIAMSADALDFNDHLLGVKNGVVDLRTGSFRQSDPACYITKTSRASFDKYAKCPLWNRFVLDIMGGDKELAQFLQRCIGYTLMGGNPEQIILILYGSGANGKSTLLRIVQLLLGTYARTVESSLFLVSRYNSSGGPREDIVRLKGARIILTTEIGEGEILDENLVKRMTGDDTLAGRVPYGKSTIEFQPKFVPWMAANNKPIIRGDDHAIWRRIILIPFTQTFSDEKQDKRLLEKLTSELPGILNWAIEGCLAWQQGGLQPPDVVTRATQEYRTEMDLLAEWLESNCDNGPGWSTSASLYSDYKDWCEKNFVDRPMDIRIFGRKLASKGFERGKVDSCRGFRGIKLKPYTGRSDITTPFSVSSRGGGV